jgi:hypothetical protein
MCVSFISVVCASVCLSFPHVPFPCNTLCVKYTKQYEVNCKGFPIHALNTYRGVEVRLYLLLALALREVSG